MGGAGNLIIHFPAQYSLIKMKFLSTVLLTTLLSAVVAGGKVKKLKAEIQALEEAFSSVLEDTEGAIANLTARLDAMAAERVELDQAHAWQALHMAAAAACRGSTPTGGSGNLGNAVLAKENTKSCNQICGETTFNKCDADVSISGYKGKATSYSQRLGHFYNYGCGSPGNQNAKFDEVKAGAGDVFYTMETGNWYYRFCCCRKG